MNAVTPIRPPARTLPHNLDLEASILGGVILKPSVLDDLAELASDDFYHWPHRIVWDGIRNLATAGKPIDVVMLEAEIEKTGKLESIGGISFLGELAHRVPTHENVVAYRDDVRQLARNRRAIIALTSAVERAYNWPHDADQLIPEVAGELGRIEATAPRRERVKLIDVGQALQELEALAKAPIYTTPFPTLNETIGFGGMVGTQVYTLAAGTGRGKTSFVAQCAHHTAMQDVPVLVVSYEMRPGYFVARKAAGLVGVHSNAILRGEVNMGLVLRSMPAHRLFMLHKPPLGDVRIAVDQLAQKFGTAPLVVVDYLQKLANQIARTMSRPDPRAATTEASETLVDIADRSGSAIISVSAIGRGNNRRAANPRELEPYELVDVAKESGDVEYDGAGVIMLSLSKDFDGDKRIATITLAKARFGREAHIDARYDGRRGDWTDEGEVSALHHPTSPANDARALAVRGAIVRVLRSSGPLKSKSAIQKLTGRAKPAVLSEIDAMLDDGSLAMIGNKFALPEHIVAAAVPSPQGALAALITEATT